MKVFSASETKVAYKVTRTMTGVECDVCHKVIPAEGKYRNDDGKYYEVTTGHHDWGHDSCESRKTIDICPACLSKYIADYFTDASSTAYLEVETECAYPEETSQVVDRLPKEGEVTKEGHDWW